MSIHRIDIVTAGSKIDWMVKTEQLQLRVSAQQKQAIKRQARLAGQDVSRWVLGRLLPLEADELQRLIDPLRQPDGRRSMVYASIHDYLAVLPARALGPAAERLELHGLAPLEANYVAAMIEQACANKFIRPPEWLRSVRPLAKPWFASELKSLRLHLLTSSPPPFRRRNLFIDSTLGDRV
jgi:uncharacterized protein (DUF1778 family)